MNYKEVIESKYNREQRNTKISEKMEISFNPSIFFSFNIYKIWGSFDVKENKTIPILNPFDIKYEIHSF